MLSSQIEGTRATLSDLALYEVEPAAAQADEFRRSQNWIGPPGCTIEEATYVPPPPERLWECLDPFEKYLHADHDLPPLIVVGSLHYQFEAIHPFLDGNGRLGRLLIALLMVEWGLLPAPVLDLSAYIEPKRDEYYQRLLRVSTTNDWHGWLGFFVDAVAQQSSDAVKRAVALGNLRSEYRARVTYPRSSALLPLLVDELFMRQSMTVAIAQSTLGVTARAATQAVERLVDLGVLTEIRRGRRRYFLADEILKVASGL